MGTLDVFATLQPATCAHRSVGGAHSDRLYFAHACLQFPFDHEDFALLPATSHLSIARMNACLALASKTLTLVYRYGRIIKHFADRRK